MQARAILKAAVATAFTIGVPVVLEIMVPLIGLRLELDYLTGIIDGIAAAVAQELAWRSNI